MKFVDFKKIPRLSRDMIITEKIDGSNGQICVFKRSDIEDYYIQEAISGKDEEVRPLKQSDDFIEKFCLYIHPENPHVEESDKLYLFAASRNRWLTTGKQNDNHAFAYWVQEHGAELVMLGEGRHYGEWYGNGIQRGYGLENKRFALFNVSKWQNRGLRLIDDKQQYAPVPCEVVPVLYEGMFDTNVINVVLEDLRVNGSKAVPGYFDAEGVVIYHCAAGQYFKKTTKNDEKPKNLY
jgi:hypothetical protein